jgi:hypothetical protein
VRDRRPVQALRPGLGERRFRLSPGLELVPLGDVAEEDRAGLGDGLFGLAYSQATGRPVLAIDVMTASGLLRLEAGGRRGAHGNGLGLDDGQVARLVCDGVVEVAGETGRFFSGAAAYGILFGNPEDARPAPLSPPHADVSLCALEYVVLLPVAEASTIARRLYAFNAVPRSRHWEARLGDEARERSWLRLESLDADPAFRRLYAPYRPNPHDDPWYRWRLRSGADGAAPRYKAYVATSPESLPATIEAVVEVCVEQEIPAFKVGRGCCGILRPDRCIVYVHDKQALGRAGRALQAKLRGLPCRKVPFTAPLGDCPLLSWGVDPPHAAAARPGATSSWRRWITRRLADAIAQTGGLATEVRIAFALQRLRLEGVDVASWRAPVDW